MAAKSKSQGPRLTKANRASDIEERIRIRAHELYERRGRVDGFTLDDWLQAETEIRITEKHGSKSKRDKGRGKQC